MEHGERLMREVVDEKMNGTSTQQEKRKILEQDGKSRNRRLPSLRSCETDSSCQDH